MDCQDDKRRVKMFSRTENGLMAMAFFATLPNDSSWYSSTYLQFDHQRADKLASLSIYVLKWIEMLGLYSIIRRDRYDPVLCLSTYSRSREVCWSHYSSSVPVFLGYAFSTGKVFHDLPLRVKKRLKTNSTTVIDVRRREARWLCNI